jgi:glycosyltransferase involved in cell wall biosynthesis
MDYVWGELPILTNGGDPLSEQLLEVNAAIKLASLSKNSIVAAIKDLGQNPSKLETIKNAVIAAKPTYYWDRIVKPIAYEINKKDLPSITEATYRQKLGVIEPATENMPQGFDSPTDIRRPVALSRRVISYARRKGLKRSAHMAYRIGRTQLKKKTSKRSARKYVFISHPIDNSGAPLVLLRMINEFAKKFGSQNIVVVTPGVLPHHLKELKQMGIKVDKAALGIGDRIVDLQLGLNNDDFVIMNTLAIYPDYRGYILRALASGRIKHAYWFIHEDTAQIPFVASELTNEKETQLITDLANQGKLTLVVPSRRVQQDYMKLWKIKNVKVLPLYVDVADKYKLSRPSSDYSKLSFLLSGSPADSRKGQLMAMSAFYSFMKDYYEKSPNKYRDFTLNLVGIGDDYVSQQIKVIGKLLGKRLKIYESMPYEDSLAVTRSCNAVICCSLNETFALYVAEGMYMGHVLLRNNSAGMEEQLKDGVNGLFIDTTDIKQFTSAIERLLNKQISDDKLRQMGEASQAIIKPYSKNTYIKILDLK